MRKRDNQDKGFTLVETLTALAILVILLAVSAVGVARYLKYLKITELDNVARDIYMAAQNRAVLLQNSGRLKTELDGTGGVITEALPTDITDGTFYIAWTGTSSGKWDELLPTGTIDPTLRDGSFYIVYEPVSGSATDVFFVEKDSLPSIGQSFTLADHGRDARMNHTPMLGWYGEKAADEIGTKPLPTPGVDVLITNGDELTVRVTYTLPDGLPKDMYGSFDGTLTPNVELKYAGEKIDLLAPSSPAPVTEGILSTDGAATYTWVLDSLESGAQFKCLFGGASAPALGDGFTVTARLTLTADGWIESSYSAQDTDNSLFAEGSTYGSGGAALIANLRHLQNLHPNHSNVGEGIETARQLCSIDCRASRRNDGAVLDDNYNFTPVTNDHLTSYDGCGRDLTNLFVHVTTAGDAGLFGTLNGTIRNVRLSGAKITSVDGDAGGLAAHVLTVTDCTVEEITLNASGTGEFTYGGALAGRADVVKNCIASKVSLTVEGRGTADDATTYGGGLAGYADNASSCHTDGIDRLEVQGWYKGTYAGGLTGYVERAVGCSAKATGNLNIQGGNVNAGGLTGFANVQIENCSAELAGSLMVQGRAEDAYGGGLAGRVNEGVTVSNCTSAITSLTVTGPGAFTYGGGLTGYAGTIQSCHTTIKGHASATTADVTVKGKDTTWASAFGGGLTGGAVSITNCSVKYPDSSPHLTIEVAGANDAYGGGLAGRVVGAVSGCTAMTTSLSVTASGWVAYGGGLAGYAAQVKDCAGVAAGTLTVRGTGADPLTSTHGGGLAGGVDTEVTENCTVRVTGALTVEGTGQDVYGGGLLGRSNGNMSNCAAEIDSLSVRGNLQYTYGGGLVGNAADITDCTVTIAASLTVQGNGKQAGAYGGGLAGGATNITGCTVQGKDLSVLRSGGGTGDSDIENAYGGGLVGRAYGNVSNCSAAITSLTVTGDGALVYGGGLAGYASTVSVSPRTAAIDADIGTINVSGTLSYTRTYCGGLAGGTAWGITNCTARVTELLIHGSGTFTYGGGLVGIDENGNGIQQSTVTVGRMAVDTDGSGKDAATFAGGLAGRAAALRYCAAGVREMTVAGNGTNAYETYGGGLVGAVSFSSALGTSVSNCGAGIGHLTVSGTKGFIYAGGLAGSLNDAAGTITTSYAVGRISGTVVHGGGLVGHSASAQSGSVKDCYAAVGVNELTVTNSRGGLVGSNWGGGTIVTSYWLRGTFRCCGVTYTMHNGVVADGALGANVAGLYVSGMMSATRTEFTGMIPGGAPWAADYQGKSFPYPTGVTDPQNWVWDQKIHYGLWPVFVS